MSTLNLIPADVRHELETLAREMETKNKDAKTANLLRDLGEAVTGGSTTDNWLAADVFQVISPERVSAQVHAPDSNTEKWVGWLEWLRNILILSPLLVTWFGISRAVDAYAALLKQEPARSTESFLYLWSQGFDGQLNFTLGTLALVVGILLTVVVLLTAIVYALHGRIEQERTRAVVQFRARLDELLGRAALILSGQRTLKPFYNLTALERTSAQMLDQIKTEGQRIDEQRKQIEALRVQKEKEIADLSNFNKNLVKGTGQIVEATNRLGAIYDQLVKSMDGLAAPIDKMTVQQAQLLNATQEVSRNFGQLAHDQNIAVTKLSRLSNDQQQVTANLDQITKTLDIMLKSLAHTSERLGQTAEQAGAYEREFLSAVSEERKAYANFATNLSSSTDTLTAALNQLTESSLLIRTIAVDLKQIVGEIKALQRA